MFKRTLYNKQLLEKLSLRDEFIIDFTEIKKYNKKITINFICKCGNINNKVFKYINIFGGFCKECTLKNKLKKMKISCMKNLGVEYPSQSQNVKNKIKNTCIKKLGVENPSQSQEIKEKMKNTCIKKFGVENPSQSQEIREKMKNTCIKNFGVEYPLQSQEIREKMKNTCMKNFGVENPSQLKIAIKKYFN